MINGFLFLLVTVVAWDLVQENQITLGLPLKRLISLAYVLFGLIALMAGIIVPLIWPSLDMMPAFLIALIVLMWAQRERLRQLRLRPEGALC